MFTTNDPDIMWVHYMDQVTAFNGKKKKSKWPVRVKLIVRFLP